MSARTVCVTRRPPGDWEARLRAAGFNVRVPEAPQDRPLAREAFLDAIAGCDAVIGMITDRWDTEAFDRAGPKLRIIANYGVGYNNIDIEEANRRGIAVTNTPDVLTDATADIAWGLLLASARRFGEGERSLRAGGFRGWGPSDYLGVDLAGQTLGIIGPGRIGTAIARRSRGWDMRIVYTHKDPKPAFEQATGAQRLPLDELLATSDFVSLSCPLTPETRHLIGARELSLMKPTAVLVNTARGPVVDEEALVEALRERRIFAAGLDVYEREPELAPGLAGLDNAVLLPHVGSATFRTRETMARIVVDNVLALFDGRRPPTLVNEPAG